MPLAFGLGILTGQVPPGGDRTLHEEYAGLIQLAEAAEHEGYDSVWVSEHHFAPDSYLPSILPVLAALAARTARIELGAAAVVAPMHHPLRLAEDAAVVDVLSGGRLTLGLVNGWREAEFRGFGVERRERASRLEETLAILRLAFSGVAIEHRGRHFVVDGVSVRPQPLHPIPLLLGGFAPQAAERAGRLADGFIASSARSDEVAERFTAARRGASGRPLRFAAMLDVVLEPTPGATAGYRYKQEVYRRWGAGDGRAVAWPLRAGAPDALLIQGDSHTVGEALSRFAALAPDEHLTLIVRLHFPNMSIADSLTAVSRFAREVMPAVRAAAVA